MQKKIIALAIAAALATPALALAEASVYGQVNLSVDMVNDGNTISSSTNQLNSNTSRLGLKGSEDLGGGGMNAIWQVEGTLKPDTGASVLFDRNNFLGLSSASMGTVMVGHIDTPYKTSTRRLDLFGDGIADNRGNKSTGAWNSGTMMGGGHDVGVSNALNYVSPSFSGVTIAFSTVFGAETAAANTNKGSLISLAGMFEQGGIYGTVALQTVKAGSAGTSDLAAGTNAFGLAAVDDKATAFKVGGSFSTDVFAVNAVVEKIKNTIAATGAETSGTNLYVGAKFNIGSDAVKAAITKRGSTAKAPAANNDATQLSVGYDHSMSKATTVYALYTKVTASGIAADPSALSVGMRHSF